MQGINTVPLILQVSFYESCNVPYEALAQTTCRWAANLPYLKKAYRMKEKQGSFFQLMHFVYCIIIIISIIVFKQNKIVAVSRFCCYSLSMVWARDHAVTSII